MVTFTQEFYIQDSSVVSRKEEIQSGKTGTTLAGAPPWHIQSRPQPGHQQAGSRVSHRGACSGAGDQGRGQHGGGAGPGSSSPVGLD